MAVKLVVLNGVAAGREIPLPSTQFIIGRSSKCHLRPHSDRVSKVHCGITRKMGRVLVRDLQSSNGTFVNEQRIGGPTYIKDGDVLSVGPLQFRIGISSEGAAQVQRVSPAEISWLMDHVDEFSMDSSYETQILQTIAEADTATLQDPPEEFAEDDPESQRLSAGAYLKDYLGRTSGESAT